MAKEKDEELKKQALVQQEAKKLQELQDKQAKEREEAEAFKKKYSKVIKTVDTLLGDFSKGDKGLIDSLLEDFAPSDSKKKPGISARSIFKLIGYAVRNPGKIGDLITIARNPEIYQSKTFQQELLKSDNTWNFIDTIGGRLPKVGQALANFGVKEFQNGNILDQEGLKKLQPLITDQKSRFALKNIANNFLDPAADQNKNIESIVNLMLKNKAFKEYMSTKKDSLKNYAVSTVNQMIANENMQAQKKYYEELQKNGVKVLTPEHIKEGKAQVGSLQKQMESFGVKPSDMEKLANLVPILMDKPAELHKFYESYAKGDWQKLGSDVLQMARDDKGVQAFLAANADILQNIMVATAKTTAQKYLDEYKVEDKHLKVLSELVPILVNNPDDLLNLYEKGYAKPNYLELGRDVLALADKNEDVKKFLSKNAKTFQEMMVNNVLAIATSEAKPESYGLDQKSMESVANIGISKEALEKVTDLVPILLDKSKDLKEFYDILIPPVGKDGKQPTMDLNKLVNKVFEMAEDPKVKSYLKDNAKVFQEIMVNGAFATESVKKHLDTYGISKEALGKVTDIIPVLLDKPEQLKKFYEIYSPPLDKEGKQPAMDVDKLVKEVLEMSATNPQLKDYLKKNSKVFQEIMVNGAFATESVKKHLDTYGISKEALGKVTDIIPILLDKPEQLKKFYEIYSPPLDKEGKQPAMDVDKLVKEVLEMSATNPQLKDYLKKNSKVFQEIMVNGVFATPSVKEQLEKYRIDREKLSRISDIIPILLDDPVALKNFYEKFEKGDFTGLGKDLLELSKTNKAVDEYLKSNNDIFKGVVEEVIKSTPILEQYGIKADLIDLLSPLLTSKHADKVQGLINLYEEVQKADPKEQTGKYVDLAINLCKLLEDPEIGKQLNNNRGHLGKVVQNVVDNIPFLKGYLGEMKVDELASNILKDPKGLREGIEAYQKGGTALAWGAGKLIVNKMLDPEFRGAMIKGVGTWLLGDGNIKQQVVDRTLAPSNIKDVKDRPNLKELAENAIDSLDKPNPKKLKQVKKYLKNDQLFSGVNIKDKMEDMDISANFSNSTFLLSASFAGSVLKNTDFTGAKFTKINFEGAEIDGKTLSTLTEQLKNKSVSLKGVKIIGDIPKGTDLSHVDFSGADLSEVKSMKDVDLKGADLSRAILPKDNSILEGAKNIVMYDKKELAQINILTDKLVENLFGKGHARTEDVELIKMSLKEVLGELKTQDKNLDLADYLEKNMDNLVGKSKKEGLSKLYYDNSNYTTVGLTTGGIYLDKKKIMKKEFISKLDKNIKSDVENSRKPLEKMEKSNDSLSEKPIEKISKSNESITQTSLSREELIKIERLGNKIGENLFGKNHGREDSVELIKQSLQEVFKDLKRQNNNVDVTNIIGENMDKLAGEVKPGYLSTSRTGLTELYYKNSNYTTAGLTTGGIYLDKKKTQGKEFVSNLTNHIDKEIGQEIKTKALSKQVPNVKGHVVENKEYNPTTPKIKQEEKGKERG